MFTSNSGYHESSYLRLSFPGTREQAFVYAMSAAAAVWRLARGCALGSLAACSCATPPRREPPTPSALTSSSVALGALASRSSFKWGGCGDDVKSASRIAKRFLQASSPPGSGALGKFMHAVNMHNNRAGRRVSRIYRYLWELESKRRISQIFEDRFKNCEVIFLDN